MTARSCAIFSKDCNTLYCACVKMCGIVLDVTTCYMIWASTIITPSIECSWGLYHPLQMLAHLICNPNCLPTGVAKPTEHHGTTVPRFCIESEPKVYVYLWLDVMVGSWHPSVFPQTAGGLNGVLNASKKQALFHHYFLIPSGSGQGSLLVFFP